MLGSPIAHSLSPVLHRAAYDVLGLDWRYDAIEMDEARLPRFLAALDGTWRGLSLTMPLKRAVLPFVDDVSPTVTAVGAANTVLLGDDGKRRAENTDVPGMAAVLGEAGVSRGDAVVVLGGGATAAATVAALAQLGCDCEVVLRSPRRVEELTAVAQRSGGALRLRGWDDVSGALAAPVVVVTLPGDAAAALSPGLPDTVGLLVDVTYHPWPTSLARAWAQRGGEVVGGLELLVQQAALQVALMTGRDVAVDVLRAAGRRALDESAV